METSYTNTDVGFTPIKVDVIRAGIDATVVNLAVDFEAKTAIEMDIAESTAATITDSNGVIVFRRVRMSGDTVVTSSLTLAAGSYTFNGATSTTVFPTDVAASSDSSSTN